MRVALAWFRRPIAFAALALALGTGCGPSTSAPASPGSGGQSTAVAPARTLEMVIQSEPSGVASRALVERGVALHTTKRLFNADLVLRDDNAAPLPYLAEALPQLNTDSWRVFP